MYSYNAFITICNKICTPNPPVLASSSPHSQLQARCWRFVQGHEAAPRGPASRRNVQQGHLMSLPDTKGTSSMQTLFLIKFICAIQIYIKINIHHREFAYVHHASYFLPHHFLPLSSIPLGMQFTVKTLSSNCSTELKK